LLRFILFEWPPEKSTKVLPRGAILDLTGYEWGNTGWKQCGVIRTLLEEEAVSLMASFRRVMQQMRVFSVPAAGMEELQRLALSRAVSFTMRAISGSRNERSLS
jgi:hypothetical protein